MKRILPPFFFLLFTISCFATGVSIENVRYLSMADSKGDIHVIFDLKLKNSWRNARNHDAVWVFFKFPRGNGYKHVIIAPDGHALVQIPGSTAPNAAFDVPNERTGIFVYPAAPYRGDINWRISIKLETERRWRKFVAHIYEVDLHVKSNFRLDADAPLNSN